ncbi:aspartate--tRNA ligase, mitochondrial isoform X2 [Chelonus insularis]|uniref:aspartate--tRNA ligase, mitochondrial isoform X2 n=1 Tax=Chelonus insularis TaxID=460826 RepID=UPI00158CFC32|nr:aspartate--tRNA ligase, mitochondrial isoform X2 [Chelonus insularis]
MFMRSRVVNLSRCSVAIYNDLLFGLNNNVNKYKKPVIFYSQDSLLANKSNNEEVLPVNKYVLRSHTCGELTVDDIGRTVHLCGWMEYQRMGKFLTLRDSYGHIQLIIPDERQSLIQIVEKLNYESILSITGKVIRRPPGQENKNMTTGNIEIQVDNLHVLNESISQLPFNIREHNIPRESLQMQYRYLTLRFPSMQRNLRIRSQFIHNMRGYLIDQCGFVDVETPTLFRRTPGGAQEFVVPTQFPRKFYSLVQSPQQFKQLLMVGGIDRYFQIARCYRDETARPDRQPEFTQLDIEVSFTDQEGIINLVEDLLYHCWPKELGQLAIPFKRLTYEKSMETYGSEQPDLRIPYNIFNVTDSTLNIHNEQKDLAVYALWIPNGSEFLTNSTKNELDFLRKQNFEDVKLIQIKDFNDSWQTKLAKIGLNLSGLLQKSKYTKDDVLFLALGRKCDARQLLGKIRVGFTNIMESKNRQIRSRDYKFLWITDFPLFEKDKDDAICSSHHPFTAPHPEDMNHLKTDPLRVRGLHYDLVLNGSEIAGGSIRIHNAKLQQQVLNMLNIDSSQMKHLLEALDSGAPPHGGIALGLDRLVSIICNSSSIRNVIAFPKSMEGRDLMSGAPADISEEERKLYHLSILDNDAQDIKKN